MIDLALFIPSYTGNQHNMRFKALLYIVPLILCMYTCLIGAFQTPRRPAHDEPCPEYIKTLVPPDTMASVHETLLRCPNITGLDLRVRLSGCSNWPDRWNFPFSRYGLDKYPPLKSLKLEGYVFDSGECDQEFYGHYHYSLPWNKNMEWRTWDKSLCKLLRYKSNIDLWLDAMDWSQLESLSIKNLDHSGTGKFPYQIVPALKSLRKLEIETYDDDSAVDIVGAFPLNSLTHFTRVGGQRVDIGDLLSLQANSLKSLHVRIPEFWTKPGQGICNRDLKVLQRLTPRLKHLATHLHRNGTWPFETLDILAKIPPLSSLDLYLDMQSTCQRRKNSPWDRVDGCNGEEQFQTPFVNETSALDAFKYLRDHKVGEELTNVTFWVGDWEPSWDGPMLIDYDYQWFEGRKAKVVCSVVEKDSEKDWCVVEGRKEYYHGGHVADGWDWYDSWDLEGW